VEQPGPRSPVRLPEAERGRGRFVPGGWNRKCASDKCECRRSAPNTMTLGGLLCMLLPTLALARFCYDFQVSARSSSSHA